MKTTEKILWQIEIYDPNTRTWRKYGAPSSSFDFAYYGSKKLSEAGQKTRVQKVVAK